MPPVPPVNNYSWPAQVQHLLLHEDRLLAIVSGYGGTFPIPNGRKYPVLYGYKSTQVRLYSVTSAGTLNLLYTSDINGYFR
jgi:hypothetical protein